MNEIRIYKLSTGEDIIAKCISNNGDNIVLNNAMTFQYSPVSGIQFKHWNTLTDDLGDITISSQFVLCDLGKASDLTEIYYKRFIAFTEGHRRDLENLIPDELARDANFYKSMNSDIELSEDNQQELDNTIKRLFNQVPKTDDDQIH